MVMLHHDAVDSAKMISEILVAVVSHIRIAPFVVM